MSGRQAGRGRGRGKLWACPLRQQLVRHVLVAVVHLPRGLPKLSPSPTILSVRNPGLTCPACAMRAPLPCTAGRAGGRAQQPRLPRRLCCVADGEGPQPGAHRGGALRLAAAHGGGGAGPLQVGRKGAGQPRLEGMGSCARLVQGSRLARGEFAGPPAWFGAACRLMRGLLHGGAWLLACRQVMNQDPSLDFSAVFEAVYGGGK